MMRRQYVNYMDWNKATKIQNNYSDIYDYQRHNRGAFSASIGINKTSELAAWSHGKELPELRASLSVIQAASAELIDSIEGRGLERSKAPPRRHTPKRKPTQPIR